MALKWCFSDTKIVYILEVSDRFTQPKQYSRQITDNLGEGELGESVSCSAANRSIGSTIGFHNYGEGPYY